MPITSVTLSDGHGPENARRPAVRYPVDYMLADRWLGADPGDLCQLSCGKGSDRVVAYVGKAHRGSEATEDSRTSVGLAEARDNNPAGPQRAVGYGEACGPPMGTTSTR
jgi:hypothetical protein